MGIDTTATPLSSYPTYPEYAYAPPAPGVHIVVPTF